MKVSNLWNKFLERYKCLGSLLVPNIKTPTNFSLKNSGRPKTDFIPAWNAILVRMKFSVGSDRFNIFGFVDSHNNPGSPSPNLNLCKPSEHLSNSRAGSEW